MAVVLSTIAMVTCQFAVLNLLSADFLAGRSVHLSDVEALGVSLLALSWIWFGLIRTALIVMKGQRPSIRAFVGGPGVFARIVVVSVVMTVCCAAGLLLLVVPGILLALAWSQVISLLADERSRGFGALAASARLTKGMRSKVFVVFFLWSLLALPTQLLKTLADHTALLDNIAGQLVLICSWIWQAAVDAFCPFVAVVVYVRLLARAGKVLSPNLGEPETPMNAV